MCLPSKFRNFFFYFSTKAKLNYLFFFYRTVFANFPSWNFNLKRVNCLDFSLNGGFLSVGNNRGAANLYRIGHYGSF